MKKHHMVPPCTWHELELNKLFARSRITIMPCAKADIHNAKAGCSIIDTSKVQNNGCLAETRECLIPIDDIYKSIKSEWYSVVTIIIRNFYIMSNRLRNELQNVFLPRIDRVRCRAVLKDLGAYPKSSVHMQSKLEVQSSVTGLVAPVLEPWRAGHRFVMTAVYRQHRHFGSQLVTVALPCYFDHPDGISISDPKKIQDFIQ
ncbi:hypothetical protein EV421DRAFT_1988086 [Armillaria borealis]|uniref:Uncharacterized protein n=1 Tax=Armillaria borealis TaxID=47425 RepID=A0AA39J559_9AGAR|nr:hypothetical protein EV421DRAFT_1988086 [Armillaria borealis]